MARRVALGDVVAVVGDQRRDPELAADLQQPVADPAFDLEAVFHQFEEEVLFPEDVLPFGGGFECLALVTETQPRLHLAGRAAGGRDDALGVSCDQLGVHTRPLAELAFDGGQRR